MAPIEPGAARPFCKGEEHQLLSLMRELAEFEGYIDDFKLSAADIVDGGLSHPPRFYAHVVPDRESGQLLGMAVTYILPWTYSGRPHLVLKELFVIELARGHRVGVALMDAVKEQAARIDAFKIQWTVLSGNQQARDFYRGLGAAQDMNWENWEIT